MSYSLAAAAEATGLNKTTVLRAIKSGKISGTRNEQGEWVIEPAELHRVYPPVSTQRGESDATPRDATPDIDLRIRVEIAEQRLADMKVALADMTEQRDKWAEQAARLAIPDQRVRRWWWRRG